MTEVGIEQEPVFTINDTPIYVGANDGTAWLSDADFNFVGLQTNATRLDRAGAMNVPYLSPISGARLEAVGAFDSTGGPIQARWTVSSVGDTPWSISGPFDFPLPESTYHAVEWVFADADPDVTYGGAFAAGIDYAQLMRDLALGEVRIDMYVDTAPTYAQLALHQFRLWVTPVDALVCVTETFEGGDLGDPVTAATAPALSFNENHPYLTSGGVFTGGLTAGGMGADTGDEVAVAVSRDLRASGDMHAEVDFIIDATSEDFDSRPVAALARQFAPDDLRDFIDISVVKYDGEPAAIQVRIATSEDGDILEESVPVVEGEWWHVEVIYHSPLVLVVLRDADMTELITLASSVPDWVATTWQGYALSGPWTSRIDNLRLCLPARSRPRLRLHPIDRGRVVPADRRGRIVGGQP